MYPGIAERVGCGRGGAGREIVILVPLNSIGVEGEYPWREILRGSGVIQNMHYKQSIGGSGTTT